MTRGKVGPTIILDWYDGPLVEIARVDFGPGPPFVDVTAPCQVTGEPPHRTGSIRLSREHLVKMLDLLDGKPVEDYEGKVHQPSGATS